MCQFLCRFFCPVGAWACLRVPRGNWTCEISRVLAGAFVGVTGQRSNQLNLAPRARNGQTTKNLKSHKTGDISFVPLVPFDWRRGAPSLEKKQKNGPRWSPTCRRESVTLAQTTQASLIARDCAQFCAHHQTLPSATKWLSNAANRCG